MFDLVFFAVADLDDHVRVGNLRPGHAHHVHHAGGQNAFGLRRVPDALGVHHRHLGNRLDACGQMHKWLGRQRHRRHAVDQGVMGVGARTHHAQEIYQATLGHGLGNFLGHLMADAVFMELVAAHAHSHAKIGTHLLAHSLQNLHAKAQAVF